MKKVISILMIAAIILSVFAMMASGLTSNGFTYVVKDGGAEITAYNNNSSNITIPETLGGYAVTSIGDFAFANRAERSGADISSLTLPSSLKRIGDGAFTINSTITSLTIPENVEYIGARAFHCWIKLSSVDFGGTKLKTIGKWAFRNCHSLNSLSLPESVETIDVAAFSYCNSLVSVDIPESVCELGREAFLACTSLSDVYIRNSDTAIGDNCFDLTLLDSSDSSKRALTIHGHSDSTAQRFASLESFNFVSFSDSGSTPSSGYAAASTGPYYVRITYSVTDSNNFEKAYKGVGIEQNDSAGISVLCRSVNGTDSVDKEYKWDIRTNMKNTGTYTVSAMLEGFPSLVYGYLDDNYAFGSAAYNINKLEVGSSASNTKTVWTGQIFLSSKINGYGVSLDWDNISKNNYFGTDQNNYVGNTSGAWEKPYAHSLSGAYANSSVAFEAGEPEAVNSFTYSAKDQYGVNMDYSLCTVSSSSSVAKNTQYITSTAAKGSGETECSINAHLSGEGSNEQTVSTTFLWKGKDKTVSKVVKFTLVDEKYEISWLDESGAVLDNTEVYYGDMPEYTLPEKVSDENYHYVCEGWSPEVQTAQSDVSYTAVYTLSEHDFEIEYTSPTCTKAGKRIYSCKDCSYQKTEILEALGHNYEAVVTEPDCTNLGYTVYTCSVCGDSYVDDFKEILGHDFSLEIANSDTLRTEVSQSSNATYYYTCSRCDAISKESDKFFEVVSASISGAVDMSAQFKPITVSIMKADEIVTSKVLEVGSSGEFAFIGLEPDNYSLVLSGDATTVVELVALDLTSGEKLDLKAAQDENISLLEVNSGDVNSDGIVDIADISCLLLAGTYGGDGAGKNEDINNDGVVNISDISIALLASNYGSTSKEYKL